MRIERADVDGFSLIELLIVIVVLGVLAAVVVAAVGGLTAEAEETGCAADAHTLYTSSEAYFAQKAASTIPAADATADGVEKILVAEGFLRRVSTLHNLDTDGQLVQVVGSPCTV